MERLQREKAELQARIEALESAAGDEVHGDKVGADKKEAWLGRLRWSESLVAVESRTSQVELAQGVETTLREREDRSSEGVERQWTAEVPIPVPVTLRDFAQEDFDPDSPVALWDHIIRRLEMEDLEDAAGPLRRQAREGRVIFLLDGVDEVPAEKRACVWTAIAALAGGPYGGNRWLATCRVLSFDEGEAPPGVPDRTLQPFDEAQVDAFIDSWYGSLAEAGELGGEQAGGMARSLQGAARRPRLRALAQNPMLLTIMALVQTYHGTLPDERAKPYQACVETLLLRWQRHKETAAVCGAQDLSGNVWEWCRTRYRDEDGQKYPLPYRSDDGREELGGDDDVWRILRGGAFAHDQGIVHTAFRDFGIPISGFNFIGFRVVEISHRSWLLGPAF